MVIAALIINLASAKSSASKKKSSGSKKSGSKKSGSNSKSKSGSSGTGKAGKNKAKYLKIKKVHEVLNKIRKKPKAYAQQIQKLYISQMDAKNKKLHKKWKRTFTEGLPAMQEALKYLNNAKPVPPLKLDMGMSYAAFKHSVYMLTKKKLDHTGKNGSSMSNRLEEYGDWQTTIGENIFKTKSMTRKADVMVLEFVIDDGVKNRGHRENIMKKDFKTVGVGIASDGKEDWVTLDFSGGFNCKKCSKITKAMRDRMGWTGPVPSGTSSSGARGLSVIAVVAFLASFVVFLEM